MGGAGVSCGRGSREGEAQGELGSASCFGAIAGCHAEGPLRPGTDAGGLPVPDGGGGGLEQLRALVAGKLDPGMPGVEASRAG